MLRPCSNWPDLRPGPQNATEYLAWSALTLTPVLSNGSCSLVGKYPKFFYHACWKLWILHMQIDTEALLGMEFPQPWPLHVPKGAKPGPIHPSLICSSHNVKWVPAR